MGREFLPGSPVDSEAICVSEEGASKLKKIVILTERPEENDCWVPYLRSLFPDCQIKLLSRPAAILREDFVDPQHVVAGNGKMKE